MVILSNTYLFTFPVQDLQTNYLILWKKIEYFLNLFKGITKSVHLKSDINSK